ncbi:rCG49752 [Rattus norvegicus]|nr:rCG49752 [Rattus norvegicus]
MNRQRLL